MKKNPNKIRTLTPSRIIFNIINYAIFGIFAFVCIYPMYYVAIYTLSVPALAQKNTVVLYPLGLSLFNLRKVLTIDGIWNAVFISVARTVLGTCLTVLVCMFLGYAFSKQHFPARKFLYRMLVITMYVHGGMVPTYLVFRAYGLLNTFWVYIIPAMISAYYVILIKTFVEQIPPSLEESAFIDGAGYITVFLRIIFPMCLPIVATIAIYAAVHQWNSWFDNHVYVFGNKRVTTLQYMLYRYLQEAERLIKEIEQSSTEREIGDMLTPFGVRMAVTLITVIPVMFVYPFLQRYIIKGIMIGAVKG